MGDAFLVMRDQLSWIPLVSSGEKASPFPYDDHPALPTVANDAAAWQTYLNRRFCIRPEDAAIIVPARNSGRSPAKDDLALFTPGEKELWGEPTAAGHEHPAHRSGGTSHSSFRRGAKLRVIPKMQRPIDDLTRSA